MVANFCRTYDLAGKTPQSDFRAEVRWCSGAVVQEGGSTDPRVHESTAPTRDRRRRSKEKQIITTRLESRLKSCSSKVAPYGRVPLLDQSREADLTPEV